MRIFIFLVFFSLSANVSAQEVFQGIRSAIEDRNYQIAFTELQNLEKGDRRIFSLNNYDYLLGRVAEERGDFATAAASYQTVVNRDSILSEYALRRLAQIARSSGNLMLERIYLRQLSQTAPDSLLSPAANKRLALSYFESKDFEATIKLLNKPLQAVDSQNENVIETKRQSTKNAEQTNNSDLRSRTKKRDDLVLLARAYLQNGNLTEAREIFTNLITNLPNATQPDDSALIAALSLDESEVGMNNFGREAPMLAATEHQRRALIYQFNRNFPLARLHFKAIVEDYPSDRYAPTAMYQIGRTFAQEGALDEAINWFERVQAEFPADPIVRDALSQTASAYSRVNKPKEAVARYQKFIEKYPGAENAERAYLNIVDVLRDHGENQNALKWTEKTRETFKGKLPEAIALFAQARIRISQNDWANALNDLTALQSFPDLGGTRVPGATNKAEVTFLKALTLENLRRFEEAIETYLSIPDGRAEFYGGRATERLKALASVDDLKPLITQKLAELTSGMEKADIDARRKAAQSVLRLSDVPNIRATMLETLKKSYAGIPEYQKIPNPKLLEIGRRLVLTDRPIVTKNRHQAAADELLFLGLYDEAAPELETMFDDENFEIRNSKTEELNSESEKGKKYSKLKIRNRRSSDFAYTLAVFYNRGESANRAIAYIEPLWKNVPADYQLDLAPREQLELLYPAPFADSILKFAPSRRVDPRFILAIMRQESRFRANVKSNAAARGLLQFISTTATQISAELGKENFNQDELYRPRTAILFGTQYLSNLFKKFPSQPAAVAASFNGGEDNMARWLARAKTSDSDRYVSEIIFSQSKDYVYKVMSNYRVYLWLYDENLEMK